jgi:hypothetical protein
MQALCTSMPTLALSAIYCLYHFYLRERQRRRWQLLRERVTYMLWVAAQRVTEDDACPAAVPHLNGRM